MLGILSVYTWTAEIVENPEFKAGKPLPNMLTNIYIIEQCLIQYYGKQHFSPARFYTVLEDAQSAITCNLYNHISKCNQTSWSVDHIINNPQSQKSYASAKKNNSVLQSNIANHLASLNLHKNTTNITIPLMSESILAFTTQG